MLVRAAIQGIVLKHHRRYGLRRWGLQVNHKRVARLMREDNLLAVGRRKYVLTTQSAHKH